MTRFGDLFGSSDWEPDATGVVSPDAAAYAAQVVGDDTLPGEPEFTRNLERLVAMAFQAGVYHEHSRASRGEESS